MNTDNPDHRIRLNKVMAQAGICSRRKADELILRGEVLVNGERVDSPGLRVDPATDRIEVQGRPLLPPTGQSFAYLMLHKPPKIMTTLHDPQGRSTVLDLLPRSALELRLVPVGRLDFMSEGLLLLTNDGELTHRLTHPSHHVPKVYHVGVNPPPTREMLEVMRHGMRLREGERLAPVDVRVLELTKQGPVLEMTLIQGVNRQIRRMCRKLGLGVRFLRRVAQGPVQLGDLAKGRCRELTAAEIKALRKAVGLQHS